MSSWHTVCIDGEVRIVADEDPSEFLHSALAILEDAVGDVEFDVEPGSISRHVLEEGAALWLCAVTMRYSESFWSAAAAEEAAFAAATKLEAAALAPVSGVRSTKIVFQLGSVDSEDWDNPDLATQTLREALGQSLGD